MGEVYRARDTKLGREVAIKVLPEAFSNSEEKLARFEREARLLASLNHPNVATLYGLEKEDGVPFLAMELVEGETLGERIGRGSIPLDEALPFFTQIAAGLEAAHEKGIVHRDLKPANIKVTPEGKVKVLDFGLGKAMAGEPTSVDLSQSPTLTREGTATSVILGTAPYMSPEQARGKPVDKRTDVWAFGCVLYEALTARVAFPGETVSDTIVSILKQDPDWQALPEETPAAVRSLLRRCLRKDLERRQHDIADARIEIEDALSAPHESATRTGESPRSLPRTGLVMALLLAVLIGLGTGWIVFRHTARTIDASLRQLTANPVENMVSGAAISADGTYVAYTDSTGTWVRVLETGETRLLPETEGRHFWEVSWFPDGTKLLATGPSESGDQVSLYAISILGGAPRKLRDNGWRGSVSPDGSRIVYLNASPPPSHEVWLMDANGSNAKIIASGKDRNFWQAAWTPDGQRVLYGALRVEGFESYIESYELEGEKTAMVLSDDRLWQFWRGVLPFVWTPDDQLICAVREPPPNHGYSNLWKFKIDKGQGRAVGTPTRITNLVGVNFRDLRLTADGKLLTFLRQRNQVDVYLAEIAEGGQHLGTPRRLTLDERTDMPSGWAADSRSVLFSSDRGGNRDVYQQSIDGTVAQVVVQGPENEGGAQFSPDGSMILYWSGGSLQRVPASGGPPTVVLGQVTGGGFVCPHAPDQGCVLSEQQKGQITFSALDPLRGKGQELARAVYDPSFYANWDLSPDGSHVAVVTSNDRVQMVPLDGGESSEIVVDGWTWIDWVSWTVDGGGLFINGFSPRGPTWARGSLLWIDFEGNVEVLRDEPNEWDVNGFASPDGRHLAFMAMIFDSNVWMLENF